MIVLRTLAIVTILSFMSSCGTIDRIESDVAAAKVYLRGSLAPGQCHAPGEEDGSKSCYYYLEMTQPQVQNMFSAKVAPDVYMASLEDCEKTNKDIPSKYQSLKYDCPKTIDGYPDRDTVYTFNVVGDTAGLTPGQKVNLESVPGSKALRKSQKTFDSYLAAQKTRKTATNY